MSLMPFPHYPTSAAGGFDMTAGDFGGGALIGWLSASLGSALGTGAVGSATGVFDADGGTVEGVYFSGIQNQAAIESGSASASNINIDGTDYTLTFSATSGGFDYYYFGPGTSLFTNGITYSITVT